MALGHDDRQAYVEKARVELAALADEGVVMAGNAFSSYAFLKGELTDAEKGGAPLLQGSDGKALRASLVALGYAPEDWVVVSVLDDEGEPLAPGLLRRALAALDPATLVAEDELAAAAIREAYADELVALDNFEAAMLAPGQVVRLQGMRVMNLGGFAAALGDARQKQLMWARLKQLPPLGEPY